MSPVVSASFLCISFSTCLNTDGRAVAIQNAVQSIYHLYAQVQSMAHERDLASIIGQLVKFK